MKRIAAFLSLAFATLTGLPALADGVEGLWLTGPDRKGQVGHVRFAKCGPALCGTILRAYDKSGAQVVTPNVGRQVIFGMAPAGGDAYAGKMILPQFKATIDGTMKVKGGRMELRGCYAGMCQSQVWTRLK